jgi:hypothetical protein
MKKLLSVVAVAAIVTSAFAFNTKNLTFCVRNAAGTACQIVHKVEDPSGPIFKQYTIAQGWDGTALGCTQAPIAKCATNVNLIGD